MDINQKIAQRRLEREREAETERAKVAAQRAESLQVAKSEARRQLVEEGVLSIADPEVVKREKEKFIEKMAQDSWETSEKWKFAMLVFFCILGFFAKWWIGLFFFLWAFWYSEKVNERHKVIILKNAVEKKGEIV